VFAIIGLGRENMARVTSADPRCALDVAIAQAQVPHPIDKDIRKCLNEIVEMRPSNAATSVRISELLIRGDIDYKFGEDWTVSIGTVEVI